MIDAEVGEFEAQDIRDIVAKILRELGNPEPPLNLDQVRMLLKLDLGYYSTADTSLVQELTHRIRVAGKQLLERPMLLIDAIRKAKLSALWVPDNRRILIDSTVPKPKHRWIEGHEIGHSVIPWHREFLFGDNKMTLDPTCHAIVEAEANFASAQLLFLQDRFAGEARDVALGFEAVKAMSKRYNNTLTSTLWRMIQDREPDRAVFGMVSAHPHYLNDQKLGRNAEGETVEYFIRSRAFRARFADVSPEQAFSLLAKHARRSKGGPLVDTTDTLVDADGNLCEFQIESFCNTHRVLTIGGMTRLAPIFVSAVGV